MDGWGVTANEDRVWGLKFKDFPSVLKRSPDIRSDFTQPVILELHFERLGQVWDKKEVH